MSTMTEYDTGPLNWVREEIDKALKAAQERILAFRGDQTLTNALRLARNEVHQASGAIRLVGLEGAATLCAAMEDVLGAIDDGLIEKDAGLDAVAGSLDGLARWVARTAEGRGEGELALFPFYRSLRLAQGAERVFEGELFFPDLQSRSAAPAPNTEPGPEEFHALVKSARAAFQRGLLAFLKGKGAQEGLAQMRAALARIEAAAPNDSSRTFWWACTGFIDTLLAHGVEADFHVKQLLARIDLQMRHLLEGSPQVAERLMRDALFFIAKSEALDSHAAAIKSNFGLDRYAPKSNISADALMRLRPVIDGLKNGLANARNAWHDHTEHKPESLALFQSWLDKLREQAAELGVPAVQTLLTPLQLAAAAVPAAAHPETLNLEIATTLLFLQQALESEDVFSKDFAGRADIQCQRLQAVAAGQALPEHSGSLMDEGSRQVRDHAVMGQLGQEVGVNLRRMEEILDAFFRNAESRDELPLLNELAQQVNGALAILDQLPASLLLDATMDLISPSIQADTPVGEAEQHRVADALSSLELFVEAHCAGRSDAPSILTPVLKDFGLIPQPASAQEIHQEAAEIDVPEQNPAVAETAPMEAANQADLGEASTTEPLSAAGQVADLIESKGLELIAEEGLPMLPDLPAEPPVGQAVASDKEASSDAGLPALEYYVTPLPGAQAADNQPEDDLAESAAPLEPVIDAESFCPISFAAEPASISAADHDTAPAADEPSPYCALPAADDNVAAPAADECGPYCELPSATDQISITASDDDVTPAAESVAPASVDAELLDIFLEEAQEVLASLAEATVACRDNFADGENLAVMRRAFHTLKGSSRMVGLSNFGEAAWGLEQMMNSWLDANRPARIDLLDLVDEARVQFGHWTEALRDNQPAHPNMAELLERAALFARHEAAEQELVQAEPQAEQVTAPEVQAEPIFEPAPQPEDVRVGSISLSPGLYEVFVEEAAQRLDVMHEEMAHLAEQPQSLITEGASRAVHTLAGIAATAGFSAMSDLAHVLELYWAKLGARPQPDEALSVVHATVNRLDDMLAAISNWKEPSPALDLIETVGQLPCTETSLPASIAMINEEAAESAELPVLQESTSQAIEPGMENTVIPLEIASAEPASTVEETIPAELEAEWAAAVSAADDAPAANATESAASDALRPEPDTEPPVLHGIAPQPVAGLPSTPSPVFEKRAINDEIDAELLPIFLEEAETLVPDAAASLRTWKENVADNQGPAALRRVLHTLKGSARMAGANRLGELTHAMESRVIDVLEGRSRASAEIFETLEAQFDRMVDAVERLHQGPEVKTTIAVDTPVTHEEVMLPQDSLADENEVSEPDAAAASTNPTPAATPVREAVPMLRVRADWVDRMVNQAGEVSIARSRIESEMFGLKRHVVELAEALNRLKTHIREVEIQAESQMQANFHTAGRGDQFDPLEFDRFTRFQEVTRFVAESVNDIATVQHTLLGRLGETQAALTQQARLNRELQQDLLRVRMVPIYSIAERLYRVVRQTARELGKRAQIDIRNGELELDRSVLEKVTAPLEHLLRNAIAHGLEDPVGRSAAGKPEFGEILLSARQEGNEIVLILKDDGAGLNLDKIRAKSEAQGLLSPGMEPTDSQLAHMIFQAGFSTADEVTAVAGRGVGMDVVKSEITALGGRVEVASEPGRGVTFTIYLPLTLAVAQAVIITAGKQDFALPTTMVGQVQELKPEQLSAALAAGAVEWRGARYPLFYLPHLLGQLDASHELQRFNSVVLMKSGASHAAFLVDQIQGAREIVVKNIGPQLARISGIAGATVQGDGRIMLILNPMPLALRALQRDSSGHQPHMPHAPVVAEQETKQAPLVMVVDDSLTVRKITGRLLAREGYRTESAKDGVDALEKMHDLAPDLVLLDVEMPRMDGFELARIMRSDPVLKHVPIIMITSRTADKHRKHAAEIGVNVYLGKPYQEALLLGHIAEFLAEKSVQTV